MNKELLSIIGGLRKALSESRGIRNNRANLNSDVLVLLKKREIYRFSTLFLLRKAVAILLECYAPVRFAGDSRPSFGKEVSYKHINTSDIVVNKSNDVLQIRCAKNDQKTVNP